MECFNKVCNTVHKRKVVHWGYLKTEGGITRLFQLILVLGSFTAMRYYNAESFLTTMTYSLLVCSNVLMFAFLITFTLAIMNVFVDTRYYKRMHVGFSEMITAMSIFQQSIIYTFAKRLDEASYVLMVMSLFQISVNIYDWYFGSKIEEPLNESEIFYFNGERRLIKFSDCKYEDTARDQSKESVEDVSTHEESTTSITKETDSETLDSAYPEAISVICEEVINDDEFQKYVINGDVIETSGTLNSSSKSDKVNEGISGTVVTKANDHGAASSISQTKEPDDTALANKKNDKAIDTETATTQIDKHGETSNMSEKGGSKVSLALATATDGALTGENTKEIANGTSAINAINKENEANRSTNVEKHKDGSLPHSSVSLPAKEVKIPEKTVDTSVNVGERIACINKLACVKLAEASTNDAKTA